MSDINSEKPSSSSSTKFSTETSPEGRFQDQLALCLQKLKLDPGSITTEEARLLSENVAEGDERSVRIISAIESLAIANEVCTIRDSATFRLIGMPC